MKLQTNEKKFWDTLENLFTGAEVEGQGGYINLLKVKRKYFKNYVTPNLIKYIDEKLKEFPDFKEELYDKLYSFFHRYFSETGSIYFSYTPLYYKIYEKIYNNDKPQLKEVITYNTDYEQIISDKEDVSLFWKTHMLYYVKTDKIIKSMKVEIPEENLSFYFDASEIELKKSNEKRELIYDLKEVSKDGTIVLKVTYSEKGSKTKKEEIIRRIKKENKHLNINEEYLDKAIRTFEKQANVDYFINKNAEKFLKEQFDLWMYQYLFSQETNFDLNRFKQLQALKDIAYRIIEFIAQFEDELRKIWEKPRWVFNSNYVITLDRMMKKEGSIEIIKEIINQLKEQEKEFRENLEELKKIKNNCKSYRERFENYQVKNQLEEWYLLDIISEDFKGDDIVTKDLTGETLNHKYQFLPVDTKYFKGLKKKIEEIFDVYNPDGDLDGWLIKSENWQALNTILSRYREKIQTIYIDPPFNLGTNADFHYEVNYKDSTWATMLENRLTLAKELLNEKGSIFVRCDYNGNWIVRALMSRIFGEENFRNEIVVKRGAAKAGLMNQFEGIKTLSIGYDSLFWFSKHKSTRYNGFFKEAPNKRKEKGYWVDFQKGKAYDRPRMRYEILGISISEGQWKWSKERAYKAVENYQKYLEVSKITGESLEKYWIRTGRKLEFIKREGNKIKYWVPPRDELLVDNVWLDIAGYSSSWDFLTENAESLLKRVILGTTSKNDLVMDFFLGSGTTTAVAHKLKRKWIGVEMGEHFYSVVLPRMKKVLAYDKSGISKEKDVKDIYNENTAGGFFKYYELEQYDDILKTIDYADTDVKEYYKKLKEILGEKFNFSKASPFIFDKKLSNCINIENGKIKVNLKQLYPDKDIDVKESILNICSKNSDGDIEKYIKLLLIL